MDEIISDIDRHALEYMKSLKTVDHFIENQDFNAEREITSIVSSILNVEEEDKYCAYVSYHPEAICRYDTHIKIFRVFNVDDTFFDDIEKKQIQELIKTLKYNGYDVEDKPWCMDQKNPLWDRMQYAAIIRLNKKKDKNNEQL
jgi:hypothetical protein